MLALADFSNPLLWAVFIGWILSVVLHEFAHGIVAHFGGDYTIRERGGLSLNPLQYVDPLMSLVFPAIIFLLGGVPLPGGVTYVREDLLRGRGWRAAVSAAGPLMNLLLFLLLILPFHPKLGLIEIPPIGPPWSTAVMFLAAMGLLQFIAAILNLIPVPPLDGFQIIRPYLPPHIQERVSAPHVQMFAFWIFFAVVWRMPGFFQVIYRMMDGLMGALGFDGFTIAEMARAYNSALFGHT